MLLDDKWIVRIHVQGQTGHMYDEKVTFAEEYREKNKKIPKFLKASYSILILHLKLQNISLFLFVYFYSQKVTLLSVTK